MPGAPRGLRDHPARDLGPRLASFVTGYDSAMRDQFGHLYFWVRSSRRSSVASWGCPLQVLVGNHLKADERFRKPAAYRPTSESRPRTEESYPDFVGAVDQHHQHPIMIFDHDGAEVAKTSSSTSRFLRGPAGSSTTRSRSGERTSSVIQTAEPARPVGGRSRRAGHHQTSVRRRWCGTSAPARPYYNAIVWQDTRTDRIASRWNARATGDVIRRKAGLPPATTSPAARSSGSRQRRRRAGGAENGEAVFGNTDTG